MRKINDSARVKSAAFSLKCRTTIPRKVVCGLIIRKVDYGLWEKQNRRERKRWGGGVQMVNEKARNNYVSRSKTTLSSTTGVNFMTRDLICSRQFTTLEYFPVFTLIRVKWHPGPPGTAAVRHTIASTFFPRSWRQPRVHTHFLSLSLFLVARTQLYTLGKRDTRVESASRTRLFHAYFISHGTASGSVSITRVRNHRAVFKDTSGKSFAYPVTFFCRRKLNFDRSKRIISSFEKLEVSFSDRVF